MKWIDTENGPVGPWVEILQHDGTIEYVRYQGDSWVVHVHPSWELTEPSMGGFMGVDGGEAIFDGQDYFDAVAAWADRDAWKPWMARYDGDEHEHKGGIYADTKEEAIRIADELVARMLAGDHPFDKVATEPSAPPQGFPGLLGSFFSADLDPFPEITWDEEEL